MNTSSDLQSCEETAIKRNSTTKETNNMHVTIYQVIENLKARLLNEHLSHMRAFVDTPTIARLLGVTESQVDEIMENGTISYVMIEGVPLIPIITLLDEMEWFPSEFYKTDHGNEEVHP